MQRGSSWQERFVTERLQSSSCLFVGMSLADPNLIRYLYGYESSGELRHAAIFVRQGEPECPTAVRVALEEAAARRWGRCGVQAIFVDHFSDAAQLLYEIGYRRRVGSDYQPIADRARHTIGLAENGLGVHRDATAFGRRQVGLSAGLRSLLDSLLHRTVATEGRRSSERLGLALWLLSEDGRGLIGWAHSDRAHQDPSTIAPVPLASDSSWVAVQAVCRGTRVELDRDNYASRWRFVRGLPLVMGEPARLPIGCITVASTKPSAESVLTKMSEESRAAFHEALLTAGQAIVQLLIDAGVGEEAEKMNSKAGE